MRRPPVHSPWDPTWDRSILACDEAQPERFWHQLIRISPESYLAEGDVLLFASIDPVLAKCVQDARAREGAA